jgi:hypothetical protein
VEANPTTPQEDRPFDVKALLVSVFNPEQGERAVIVIDEPTDAHPDDDKWRERRQMAEEWRAGLIELGLERDFSVLPLLRYAATGAHGANFPRLARLDGETVELMEVMRDVSLCIAMTTYSCTAALGGVWLQRGTIRAFRGASMPDVEKRMERSALAADYTEVARRCRLIKEAFQGMHSAVVDFSTGHRCTFDLRFRTCQVDDGYVHRDKLVGAPVINLPSGETFQAPYEGEVPGERSRTQGELPISWEGQTVVFEVSHNRIVDVNGSALEAGFWRDYFRRDAARANVAEVAFGCNEWAEVTGNTLEDEKAGFHWAFGRSDHLGGIFGASSFRDPTTVVHQDMVYARGCPITVKRAELQSDDGRGVTVIRDGHYTLW